MLLCAQKLARSRAHGLLWAQCSSPGRWHRGLRTSPTANTVHSSTSAPLSQDFSVDIPRFSTAQSQLNENHNSYKTPTAAGDQQGRNRRKLKSSKTTTDQHEHAKRNPSSSSKSSPQDVKRSSKSPTRLLSKTTVKKIVYTQGASPKLATRITNRLNAELRSQNKAINSRSLYLATVIRSNTLYSRGLALRQWRDAFKEIYVAKRYGREIQNKSLLPALDDNGKDLLMKARTDCHGSFREAWHPMHRTEKAAHWQRLAIWLLQHDPKSLPDFLIVTTECKEKPNFTIIFDCLRYLENNYHSSWLKDWRSGTHTYESMIETCLHPRDWPIVSLPQKGPRLYIRRAGHEGVVSALRIAKERSTQISEETALCFMWRFTELGDVDRALESLKYIPKTPGPGLNMESEEVLRHCCKLLTLDTVQDNETGRNFRILPQLLKMGVRPDRDMMNVVLANAYATGDPQLGTDILQFMRDHDHSFDSYTYLTLLGDAVSRGDRARVDSLIHEIVMHEDLRQNPYLTSKIFHSHYIFTAKYMDADADPSSVFYAMLDMYNQLHDITPLKELLIIPPHYTPREGSNLPPSPIALYIMIATFFRCQNRFSNVQRIYHRFRQLVEQGHPIISPMASTDHTYNEFLIALRNNPRGPRLCVRIVEDMLHSSASDANGKIIDHVKPSMRTWTILLSAFIFNRQPLAAEKIKQMMAKHDIEYNSVTWNIIINGYANAQDIPQTAIAIKAMEEQGFAIDPYTMKSLRYLRDPERLWVAIDELDEATAAADPQSTKLGLNPDAALSSEEQHEKLLDEGLEKLGNKMKPKL